jgi:hypothetical protein
METEDFQWNGKVLSDTWVVYAYNKSLFSKIATGGSNKVVGANPVVQLCEIKEVKELIYYLQLMAVRKKNGMLNMHANNYIIMRKGIKPIWEDPRNEGCGAFTAILEERTGLPIFQRMVMGVLGGTFTENMDEINGIQIQYIAGKDNSKPGSMLKIWDGKPGRDLNSFIRCMNPLLLEDIKDLSLKFSPYSAKPCYGGSIFGKLTQSNANSRQKGGFQSGSGGQRKKYNRKY